MICAYCNHFPALDGLVLCSMCLLDADARAEHRVPEPEWEKQDPQEASHERE